MMLPLRFFIYDSSANYALIQEKTEFQFNLDRITIKSSFPFFSQGDYQGIFWGFVYNQKFNRETIVSVLMQALQIGEQMFFSKLAEINGAHSGFILEKNTKKLYIWNDSLGTTPLYHSTEVENLIVSTDLNLFKPPAFKLNEDWIRKFIIDNEFNEPPEGGPVALQNVVRLGRGSIIVVDVSHLKMTIKQYKNTQLELQEIFADPKPIDFVEASQQVEDLLTENMQSMMRGYSQPGITKSGGSDSYLVYAIGRKIGLNWKILSFDYDHLFEGDINPSMAAIMQSLPEEKYIFKLDDVMRSNAFSYFRNFPPKINEKPYLHNPIFKKLSEDSGVDILFNGILGDPFFGHRINYYLAILIHRKFSNEKKSELIAKLKTNANDVNHKYKILDHYLRPLIDEIENKSSYILCETDLDYGNIEIFLLKYKADYVNYILNTTNTFNWSSRDWSDMGLATASPINDERIFKCTLRWPTELLAKNSLNIEIQRHIIKKYLSDDEFKIRNKFDEINLAPFWKYQLKCTDEILTDFSAAFDFVGELFNNSPQFLIQRAAYNNKKTLSYNEIKILSLYYWYKNWKQ